MAFIEFKDVGKVYRTGEVEINALHREVRVVVNKSFIDEMKAEA